MPDVTVIIPVLNNWELTRACLTNLARYSTNIAVTVADNASTDETAQACPALGRELFGANFFFLHFPENCHFGPACTAAARMAHTDLVLFLNNDTEVTAGWLPPLLNAMTEDPMLIGAGPLLLYPNGTVQHLGTTFWPEGEPVGHLYRHLDAGHPLVKKRRRFQAMTGAALLLPRQPFLVAGGFCPDFQDGLEDIDLCLQLTRSGRYMSCIPESRVIHREGATPGRHDHEDANMLRLRSRRKLFMHGDLDQLLAQDGYDLGVLPQLELSIMVSPKQDQALAERMGRPFEPNRCFALLREEPFWSQGYSILGNYLEERGEYRTALTLYTSHEKLALAPSLTDYDRIMRVARKLNMDTSGLEKEWNDIFIFLEERTIYQARLDRALYFLQSSGRKELAERYHKAAAQAETIRTQGVFRFTEDC